MCFDHDSRPPIMAIAGGSLDSGELTLTPDDGNRFTAFQARAAEPTGAGVVILPDVRGLHAYYEDLALRFAEHGIDAIAIDYFGRTAGLGRRETGFDYVPHVAATHWAGLTADIRAAVDWIRAEDGAAVTTLFTVGFCFGGRVAFDTAALPLDLAGVVGFYGNPVGERADIPAPADIADRMTAPVLGIFGGADPGIPASAIETFEAALVSAALEHELVVYPDAPHSFFDRKADEYARTSAEAWEAVLGFVRRRTPSPA